MADAKGKAQASSPAPQGMMIPETVADAPTQRFYASSLFVFLQALKFYDYIQLYGAPASAETFFAIKWIAIDAAYLLLIPKLRIPWLSFGLTASLIQVAIMSILNICMSARITISLSAIGTALLKVFYDRELSVLENNVKVADIINNHSRILGQHTINVLPESTAKLNAQDSCFCISQQKPNIYIPIRMNSTIPMMIQYSRINPNDNEITRHNITGKHLKQLMKHTEHQKNKVWELPLPISEPGLYRLDRVQDTSRLDVRLYRSQALVVNCPTAALVIPERLKVNPDRCAGDMDELSLRVSGLPPLRVKYNRWIEGQERVSTIDSIRPSKYHSPLTFNQEAEKGQSSVLNQLAVSQDMLWARTEVIDVHLNSSLQQAGKWSYSIDEVQDACGNVINFSAQASDRSLVRGKGSLGALTTTDEAMVEIPDYTFVVHERPIISFRGCSPEHPTRLLNGQDAKLEFDITSADLGPFKIGLARGEADALVSVTSPESSIYKNITLQSKHQQTAVNEAGIYNIQRFSSKFCEGIVQMPSSCLVFSPPSPSLAVVYEPILDKCAGSIGLSADLTFTGTPPFDIAWKVIKDGKAAMHRRKIDRARHQLRFTPEEAGEYSYEIVGLDDINYKGIKLQHETYSTKQTVFPLAGASFAMKGSKRCCIGDSVSIPVKLVGSGPWQLTYEILHNGKRERFEMRDLATPQQVITTPALKNGGSHVISLIDIQDSNGCRTPLEAADVTIEVRRDRPSAAFYSIDGTLSTTVIEGTEVAIPLRLVGDGPWSVTYGAKTTKTINIRDPNSKIKVKEAGIYKLLDVKDSYCPGNVDSKADSFEVEWFPKPIVSLSEFTAEKIGDSLYRRAEVCEGAEDSFDIDMYGAPPFLVNYERVFSAGTEHSRKQLELNAALPVGSIITKTSPAGLYTYKIHGVSDALYNAQGQDVIFTVEQRVNSRPTAVFAEPERIYNYCMEVDLMNQEADRIPLTFTGEAPFTAVFRIKHQITGITEYLTETNIESHSWSLQVPKTLLTLGNHAISVAEVKDAKGCVRAFTEKDSHIYIAISEMPSITPATSRKEYCVGDRISYALQGSPPFKVEYAFEGVHKRATVNGPVFSRVAERPGHFSILSLFDSASKCKVTVSDFDNVIYDIPSVRVSEGKTIIESIHEGDQAEIIFHLYGTPPFSLTYTRSEVGQGRHNKVLETHSVSGILENEYVIHSSVAGTFAAIEVHDAHCRASMQK